MWGMLIGEFIKAGTSPVHVGVPNAAAFEEPTSPLTVIAVIGGVAVLGGLVWWAVRR